MKNQKFEPIQISPSLLEATNQFQKNFDELHIKMGQMLNEITKTFDEKLKDNLVIGLKNHGYLFENDDELMKFFKNHVLVQHHTYCDCTYFVNKTPFLRVYNNYDQISNYDLEQKKHVIKFKTTYEFL